MSLTTGNNAAFIEAEQYSQFIIRALHDGLLPAALYRDVSDFGDGETLNIKTVGESTVTDVTEDVAVSFQAISTGEVQLTITDYVSDAWYVTDKMRQDGSQIEQLLAARAQEATRAIQERFELTAMKALNDAQTADDANVINGQPHRIVASGANRTVELKDIIQLKLSLDKAEAPTGGRVGIVDPVVAASLNIKFQGTYNVDSNPMMQEILEGGFARDHEFVMSLFGFSIMTSNRLHKIAGAEAGLGALAGDVANLFMNAGDDQVKPLMTAWRQMPKVEGDREITKLRDEFVSTARWGHGAQRVDTLCVLLSSATDVE